MFPSCPGFSRASTNLCHFMQDVDGWDKPGHDAIMPKIIVFDLDSGNFNYQIGQPLGGIQPADGTGGHCHRGQLCRLGGER
jgi:hypothetical protein